MEAQSVWMLVSAPRQPSSQERQIASWKSRCRRLLLHPVPLPTSTAVFCFDWITDNLGLEVTDKRPGTMVFMSAGEASHHLALMSVRPNAPGPEENRVGLYHFAWEMESFEDLKVLYRQLNEKRVRLGGVGDHGISIGVYFFDPDGNEIEAYYELPRNQWPKEGSIFSGRFPLGTLDEAPATKPA